MYALMYVYNVYYRCVRTLVRRIMYAYTHAHLYVYMYVGMRVCMYLDMRMISVYSLYFRRVVTRVSLVKDLGRQKASAFFLASFPHSLMYTAMLHHSVSPSPSLPVCLGLSLLRLSPSLSALSSAKTMFCNQMPLCWHTVHCPGTKIMSII